MGDWEDLVKRLRLDDSFRLEEKDGNENVYVYGKEGIGIYWSIFSERVEVYVGIGDVIRYVVELERYGYVSVIWVLVVIFIISRFRKCFGIFNLRIDVVSGLGGDINEGSFSVDSIRRVVVVGRGGNGDRVVLDDYSFERNFLIIFVGFVDGDVVDIIII